MRQQKHGLFCDSSSGKWLHWWLIFPRRTILHIAQSPLARTLEALFLTQWFPRSDLHDVPLLVVVVLRLTCFRGRALLPRLLRLRVIVGILRVAVGRAFVDDVSVASAWTAMVLQTPHAYPNGLFLSLLLRRERRGIPLSLRGVLAGVPRCRCLKSCQLFLLLCMELFDFLPPPALAHREDAHVLLDPECWVQETGEKSVELLELVKVDLAVAVKVEARERLLHVACLSILVQNLHQMRQLRAFDGAVAIRIKHIEAN